MWRHTKRRTKETEVYWEQPVLRAAFMLLHNSQTEEYLLQRTISMTYKSSLWNIGDVWNRLTEALSVHFYWNFLYINVI